MVKIARLIRKLTGRKRTVAPGGHDDSVYDKETRNFLKTFIPHRISNLHTDKPLKVLMLGSPGLQEIRDIPADVLSRFEITGVDKAHTHHLNLPVRKYKFRRTNIFDFLKKHNHKKKFDIVFNRWLLHHVSEHNKEILCTQIHKILSDSGLMITIDWFIDEWQTPDELRCSQIKFYEYRTKYLPQQIEKLDKKIRTLTPQQWWDKLHNDCDWSGGKHTSRERLASYLQKVGFENIEIHDIGNTKVIDDPYLWGDVLVCAQKA